MSNSPERSRAWVWGRSSVFPLLFWLPPEFNWSPQGRPVWSVALIARTHKQEVLSEEHCQNKGQNTLDNFGRG